MKDVLHIKWLLDQVAFHQSEEAYKKLFLLLHKPLCQFAFGILKSNDHAQEVVSDVFIYIWEKKEKLPPIESPLIYLYKAVKNRALNTIAKERRQQALDAGEWLVPLPSVYFDPEKLMMTEELMQKLQHAVEDLPSRCRLIFKLVKDDGLKYREVAELLQISVKTVEAQMTIAMRRLGKCMQLEVFRQDPKTIKK